jgi:hypothetical protein
VLGFGFFLWIFPSFVPKLGSLSMILVTLFVAYQLRKHGADVVAGKCGGITAGFSSQRTEIYAERSRIHSPATSW